LYSNTLHFNVVVDGVWVSLQTCFGIAITWEDQTLQLCAKTCVF
jgi:hypothetical protein